jgi:hypothetical protein
MAFTVNAAFELIQKGPWLRDDSRRDTVSGGGGRGGAGAGAAGSVRDSGGSIGEDVCPPLATCADCSLKGLALLYRQEQQHGNSEKLAYTLWGAPRRRGSQCQLCPCLAPAPTAHALCDPRARDRQSIAIPLHSSVQFGAEQHAMLRQLS